MRDKILLVSIVLCLTISLAIGGLAAIYTSPAYAVPPCFVNSKGEVFCFTELPLIECKLTKVPVVDECGGGAQVGHGGNHFGINENGLPAHPHPHPHAVLGNSMAINNNGAPAPHPHPHPHGTINTSRSNIKHEPRH